MKTPLCFLALAAFAAGRLPAADAHFVVPLWPNGAPGSETRRNESERVKGETVSNIHNPSLTVFLPAAAKATGCAVIVAPGGGHQNLYVVKEGSEVAEWLALHGVAAFVLKNRLANDESNPPGTPQPYTVEGHALADAQRALRLIRSRASEWSVDPARVGIVGFSAGGEVALLAGTRGAAGRSDAADVVDRQSSRPDFFGLIYPGGISRSNLGLNKDTPPVFLTCGYNDRFKLAEPLAEFYLTCMKAGVNAELHIYAGADHGFGIRPASNAAAATWIARFGDWLVDRKFVSAFAP